MKDGADKTTYGARETDVGSVGQTPLSKTLLVVGGGRPGVPFDSPRRVTGGAVQQGLGGGTDSTTTTQQTRHRGNLTS